MNKKDKPALVNRKIGVSGAQPLTQTGEENTRARVSKFYFLLVLPYNM
ncbi:hypothetical protein BREVNS_0752 [Brevinematales bacterium NS]|nr:hypothetical protein BREVNS_0752 [Brevinematales bacterium NS]